MLPLTALFLNDAQRVFAGYAPVYQTLSFATAFTI